jgi:hypothetical protein
MYYPKSQIQTGFYSNSELIEARSKQLYTGPYFKTSDGLLYSGKEPNEGKNIVLIYPEDSLGYSRTQLSNRVEVEDYRFTRENTPYSILRGENKNITPYTPIPYYPILTDDNIQNGEFTRYFVKKSNQNSYTEINNNNFINSTSSTLYISIQLQWVISGEKENVRQINAKQIGFVEKNLQIEGLGEFLRFNYLQFYQE